MKKKIFATITTLLILVSVFASASITVFADEAEVVGGGLDFYSITLHYKEPILIRYYETKLKEKDPDGKSVTKEVKYFVNPDAETEEEKYLTSKKLPMLADTLVLPSGLRNVTNFYQVEATDGSIKTGLQYSKLPYTNAFITSIIDSSAIVSQSSVDLLGITDPYDDNPYVNQNPNVEYTSYGDKGLVYAVAAETDENGNHYVIDRNGYLVDTNDFIWKTSDDYRIELYISIPMLKKTGAVTGKKPVVQVTDSGDMAWVPYSERFDENGMIKSVQSIYSKYIVTDEEYDAFLADENQMSIKMHIAESDEAYKDAPSKGKSIAYATSVRVNKDINPDTYFSKDREFTANDILKDEAGNLAYGTPKIGTPVVKSAVDHITAEIDAAGTQLYDNVADDPQQKNILTLTIGGIEQDAALYKKWFDEGYCSEDKYKSLGVFTVGSAKSVTTRTEIATSKGDYKDSDEYGYSPTVKSITFESSEDVLARIPANAMIYINFHISEMQPAGLFDSSYAKKFYAVDRSGASTLLPSRVTLRTDADRESILGKQPASAAAETGGLATWIIIAIVAGAVVVVAAIVIIVIVASKKKTKSSDKTDK